MSTDTTIFEIYPDEKKELAKMLKTDQEVELMFPAPSYSNYIRIIGFCYDTFRDHEIIHQPMLDIALDNGEFNLRLSLLDSDEIDSFIEKYHKTSNQTIVDYISKLELNKNRLLLKKFYKTATRIDLKEYGIRLKSEIEEDAKKIPRENYKISYRYKDKLSIIFDDYRIDISAVTFNFRLDNLMTTFPKYELEMEITNHKMNIDKIDTVASKLLAVVQNNDVIMSKTEITKVISSFRKLFNLSERVTLNNRNVVSLEMPYVKKFLPNNYAVTDKPDGERMFMYHYDNVCYLITTNFILRKTNMPYHKKLGTAVFDGEYLTINGKNIFMAFDLLYADEEDFRFSVRDKDNFLQTRFSKLKEIAKTYFNFSLEIPRYNDKDDYEIPTMEKFYEKHIKAYWTSFKTLLKKDDFTFAVKQYLIPLGVDSSEIFMLTYLLWKMNIANVYPYVLDGLILSPLNTAYDLSKTDLENSPQEYKIKPPEYNTIDFYLILEKDDNGKIIKYNDTRRTINQYYYIGQLLCGKKMQDGHQAREKPIPFKINGKDQIVYLFLSDEDKEIRDINGFIIEDNTVIEASFDTNNFNGDESEMPYRWIVHKTRYDKTESVNLYQVKYGNSVFVATRIWKSIMNPVTFELFKSLSDPSIYQQTMNDLPITQSKSSYYVKKTNLGVGMRAFNNRLKNNMIKTYASKVDDVLDLACGKGGDLSKFAGLGIKSYVGIDIDRSGLFQQGDNAVTRYLSMKNKFNLPEAQFIMADARALLTSRIQRKILPATNEQNFTRMDKYLDKKFGFINCQFALHYFLESDETWNNFCENINDKLKDDGYFVATAFDGDIVMEKLENKAKYSVNYTGNDGEKRLFFEIVKMYSSTKQDLGLAINLYNSIINNPGTYFTEYLIKPDFLIKSLEKKCGLRLVETDLFLNYYLLHRRLFLSNIKLSKDQDIEIRNFYRSLDSKYQTSMDTELIEKNEAGFKFTMMNRFYVFKKVSRDTNQKRIVGINQKISLVDTLDHYLISNSLFIDPSIQETTLKQLYYDIVDENKIKPDVYLIKQGKNPDEIRFMNKKEGDGSYMILVYQKGDEFFPVFHRSELKYSNNPYNVEEPKRKYFLKIGNVKNDLTMLLN
jgi:hypothetical protein